MSQTILVAGHGPGISHAVAERFGREGFQVALVARRAGPLEDAAAALNGRGVRAAAFPADLSDPSAVRALVEKVRGALGPITALHWNAYGAGSGDLTSPDDAGLRNVYDVAVVGLVAAVQAALPDLRQSKGAVLITNGGLGFFDQAVDELAVQWKVMGLAIANSAKHKTARLLSALLGGEGVHVAEVVVTSTVKGTAFDQGNAPLDPATVGERFWQLYRERRESSVVVG